MTSAVVPAHNEEERIAATVSALLAIPGLDEVVVVDDGSSDLTSSRAQASGARVVRLMRNQGKGAAVSAGIRAASGDILLLADADLEATACQMELLLDPLQKGDADMSIATFPITPGRGGGFGLVVRLARGAILKGTGYEMRAPLSGQRAIRREVLERVGELAPGFGMEVALTIDALRAGFRVVEVETTMTHRVTGRDIRSILHRLRQYLAVRSAIRERHL